MLTGQLAAAVLGLIADAVDDPRATLPLTDAMKDAGLLHETHPTLLPDVVTLSEAARLVGGIGRTAYREISFIWRQLFLSVYDARLMNVNTPEGELLRHPWRVSPTLREAEGSETYRALVMSRPLSNGWAMLVGKAHCKRLVLRGARGEDVPPDVQWYLMAYLDRARAQLRALAPSVRCWESVRGTTCPTK